MSNLKKKTAVTTISKTNMNRQSLTTATNSKKPLTKPAWDQTNSNLEQLRPTQDELEKRRQAHLSKNIDLIKAEKQRQSILKAKKTPSTEIDTKTQLALLREILMDDNQLKHLLLKSDETLKVASSLMDNENFSNKGPKSARINFTSAPNADLNESNLPVDSRSLMQFQQQKQQSRNANHKNLNSNSTDCLHSESIDTDEANNKFNVNELIKYRQILIEKKALIESQLKKKQLDSKDLKSLNELESYITAELNDNELFKILNNQPVNDTNKINRIKARIADQHTDSAQSFNLTDFKKVLEDLEIQLIEYEEQCGRQISAQRISKYDTYSSYTISLVNVVAALLQHLKQTTFELNYEKQKLIETTKQVDIHRKLIDGLTNEILSAKSQNEKLLNEFATYEAKIETEIDQMKFTIKQLAHPSSSNNTIRNQAFGHKPSVSSSHNLRQSSSSLMSPSNDYDHFSERLNAMLQADVLPPSHQQAQQKPFNSASNTSKSAINIAKIASNQQSNMNKNYQSISNDYSSTSLMQQLSYDELSNQYLSRPASASAVLSNNANINNLLNTNKHLLHEYNTQIQDLSTRNFEAQQKLKAMQQPHHQRSFEDDFSTKYPEGMQNFVEKENSSQTLNKLKEDQQSLKEQIYMLNKQREYAQRELDIIVSTGCSTTTTTTTSLNNLNTIGASLSSSNGFNNRSSPNLSPIPTEKIFSDHK